MSKLYELVNNIATNGQLCAVDGLTFCHEAGISEQQKRVIEKYYREHFALWWNTWIAPHLREIVDIEKAERFTVTAERLGKVR